VRVVEGSLLLGIDIGSSSCKAGLFDAAGKCIAVQHKESPPVTYEDGGGRREYDAEKWWSAVAIAVRALSAGAGSLKGRIIGIGLTGQIGTHLVVSSDGVPLIPAIGWQDGRAKEEAAALDRDYPGCALDEALGMHLPPGAAWPIPRLLWVKKNSPELLHTGNAWMQPKDYLCLKLTGKMVTDVLSLRGLMHPAKQAIDPLVKNGILGIDELDSLLPRVLQPWDCAGDLSKTAARRLGLDPGIPVAVGAGDFHCAVLGSGLVDTTAGFNVTGTSDHIGLLVDSQNASAKTPCLGRYPSILDSLDILYGATSSSGGMLEWFVRNLCSRKRNNDMGTFLDRVVGNEKTSRGIVCLPYLNGERAPIWDVNARAVFSGIGSGHSPQHLILSVLEGVAFSLRHCFELIGNMGLHTGTIRVSGASARSASWNLIKANVLKLPVAEMESSEITCLGAAMLAATATGVYADPAEASAAMTRESRIIDPDPSTFPYYDDMFDAYLNTYAGLAPTFSKLAKIRNQRTEKRTEY
jgi:xylulokinase